MFQTIVILGFLGACQAQVAFSPQDAVDLIRDSLGGAPGPGMEGPIGPGFGPVDGPILPPPIGLGPMIPPGGPLPGPMPGPDTPMVLPPRDTGPSPGADMGDPRLGSPMGPGAGHSQGGGIDTSEAYNLSFPISEIQRMLEGMNKGLFYDLNGRPVRDPLAQPILTIGELQNEMDKLSGSGAGFGPRPDADQPDRAGGEGGNTITIEFTKPEVERMMKGMLDNKFTYDYQGKETNATENVLSMKQLEMLMAQFEPPVEAARSITAEFTLKEVEAMINGTRNGKAFNYQGQVAVPGERTLNMDQLMRLLASLQPQDQPTYPFTLAQVQRMINGINEGKAYNYLGIIASPGEPTLNMEQLRNLLFELQPSGVTTYTPFTLAQVQGMIDGMNQGQAYNYQGNLAIPGEATLNMNQLLQLLAQLQPKAPKVTAQFTRKQIEKMIDGMKQGELYNYEGKLASAGEMNLTREQTPAPLLSAKFTLEQIQNIIDGMQKGRRYNYQGYIASIRERTLTMEQVLQLRNQLQYPVPYVTAKFTLEQIQAVVDVMDKVPNQTAEFTAEQIKVMIDGMNQGISYNFQGNMALEGETSLTMTQLLRLQSQLQPSVPKFTLEKIESIFEGMAQGASYNEQGMPAAPGDKTLTVRDLLRSQLDTSGPLRTKRLSYKTVTDMVDGMGLGNTYNLLGNISAPGETTFSMNDLLRLQDFLKQTAMIQPREFSLAQIEALSDGILQGMTYNDKGNVATGSEPTLTLDELLRSKIDPNAPLATNKLQYQDIINMLNGMGQNNVYNFLGMPAEAGQTPFTEAQLLTLKTQLEPKAPIKLPLLTLADIESMMDGMDQGLTYNDQGTVASPGEPTITKQDLLGAPLNPAAPLISSKLTYQKVKEMMDGTSKGNSYNYLGMPAEAGQIPFTNDQLLALEAQLLPKPQIQLPPLALQDIESMIAGMDQGMTYNEQGLPASPGETAITLEDLLRTPLDPNAPLMTNRFTYQKVKEMMDGIGKGNSYNYLGMPAEAGQIPFTNDQLLALEAQLLPKAPKQLPPLALQDIESMITGMDQGMTYNDQGLPTSPGETAITLEDLLRTPLDPNAPLMTNRFTYQKVKEMMDGMSKGNSYNYLGMPAEAGQIPFTNDQLLALESQLLPKAPKQLPPLALQDIESMLTGMDQGMTYNDQGLPASPGETAITLEDLLRTPLDPNAPLMTKRFTYQKVKEMMDGMGKGNSYNYLGMPAEAGQIPFTNDQLLALEAQLLPKTPKQLPPLALQDIESMITGMDQGMTYNDQGLPASPGETAITLEDLLRTPLDPNAPIMTKRFTYQKLREMIDGMRKGNSYNYLGMPAEAGQIPFTNDQLLALESQLVPKAPIQMRPMSLPEIESLADGLKQGIAYNDQGIVASPGEPTITLDDLLRVPIDPAAQLTTTKLTYKDVMDMLDGISRNMFYNYLGMPAEAGQNPFNEAQLLTLKAQLEPKAPIKLPPLKLSDIEAMIANMDQGTTYNSQGLVTSPGEPSITKDDLLQAQLDPTAPITTKSLTYQRVNNMIDGMKQGNSYNFLGMPAEAGQTPFNEAQLLTLKTQLEPKAPIQLPMLSLPNIESMIAGMDQGMTYNDQGLPSSPGDILITLDDLLRTPIDTSAQLASKSLTYQKVADMIDGIRQGNKYNYLGMPAEAGQIPFTEDQLLDLESQLVPSGPLKQLVFALPDIEYMLEGMNQGIMYNEQGQVASPGEPSITRRDLLRAQIDPAAPLTTNRLDYRKVMDMIDGMNQGERYNFLGKRARGRQTPFTMDQLLTLKAQLEPIEFSLEEIEAMIQGIEQGVSYTPQGKLASPGEPVMSMNDLLRRKLKPGAPFKTSRFTYDKVQSMIDGMDAGNSYNFLGSPAETGQSTFTRGQLRDLRSFLKPKEFSLEEIEAIIKGMEQGASYNPHGVLASPGEPIMTIKDLLRRKLDPSVPLRTSRFTYNQIKNMIDGMDMGDRYNFLGNLAETGQTTFKREQLIQLRSFLQPKEFSLEEIEAIIRGIEQGASYNPQGKLASPGDPLMTLKDLLRRGLKPGAPLISSRFTYKDVQDMIDAMNMDKTVFYNLLGQRAEPDQAAFTLDQLLKLRANLQPPGSNVVDINPLATGPDLTSKFTIAQVENMILGMRKGMNYNSKGFEAEKGEKKLELDYLERLLERLKLLASPDWKKAKLNSAICHNCTLPSCYLPYDQDCKSYIVCQRQASGNYVAWKMRCAFGAYWGTGKVWTCERVEDLAKMGYRCQNDKCRDPNLKVYPDEEEKNCRTYWKCEKGMSKPACCPPGYMFSRKMLKCVRDLKESCRKPCPLKIEGCANTNAKTQPFYDGNCRTYWDCERGYPHPVCCKMHYRYDTKDGTCKEDPTCNHECPEQYVGNVCGKMVGNTIIKSYALDDGNCRTFFKCFDEQVGQPWCCQQNHRYNPDSGQCERVLDQSDMCNDHICPGYKEECRFKRLDSNHSLFYDTNARVELACPGNTTFSDTKCTCTGTVKVKRCNLGVNTVFDDPENKWHVNNRGDGWISIYGTLPKNATREGITYGVFDGSSGMEVWRYDHAELPSITLNIVFWPRPPKMQEEYGYALPSQLPKEILVSNCRSVDDGITPSFEVSLDPASSSVVFFGQTKLGTASLRVPYDPSRWNKYRLLFDGEYAIAMIEDPVTGGADITSTQLKGDIIAGMGSLKFGPCKDDSSQPMNNGFVGYISEVIFAKCVNAKDRMRMMKVMTNQPVP